MGHDLTMHRALVAYVGVPCDMMPSDAHHATTLVLAGQVGTRQDHLQSATEWCRHS